MNLLILESSRSNGGTEQHTVAIAKAMQGRGHRVLALVREGSWVAGAMPAAGVPTVTLAFGGGFDPRLLGALFWLLFRWRPDWLLSNDTKFYWPLVVIRLLGGPRAALFRHLNEITKPLTRRWVPRLADRFFVVSNDLRERLALAGAPRKHLRVLYNPVDVDRFRPDAQARTRLRAQLGIAEHDTVVAFAGRLVASKGVFVLEEAFARAAERCPSLHLIWIGDGPDEASLRATVQQRPQAGRHHFLNWVADVAQVLPAADLLAVPSLSPESFGRVAAEAQACGLAVLGSDAAGLREAVQPGLSGRLLPPGDVTAWTEALLELARNSDQRARWGASGRGFVTEQFSEARIARQLESALAAKPTAAHIPRDGYET